MPLYADMYYSYLGSSPSMSNPYSVTLPSSHYGSTPISRLGLGTSSYTRTAHNFYPPSALTSLSSYSTSRYIPKLTTISESLGQSRLNRAHHRVRRAASPRPVTINTSDIDVSASKYRDKPRPTHSEVPQVEQVTPEIGERQMRGTISRNRKVIRLNTIRKAKSRSQSTERHSDRSSSKKKKEEGEEKSPVTPVEIPTTSEPPTSPKSPSGASWRQKIPSELLNPPKKSQPEKSPGEIFMAKFIIRNPPAETKSLSNQEKSPEKDVFVYPALPTHPTNKGRRTSITLQGLDQLPTFSDICQDISSEKLDDDLNAGDLRRRASLIIDEELQIFESMRNASHVTCVLEKELESDEEIDSEGHKIKKPKQKVAAKVDITNASMIDIKEFVESIKDEIEGSDGDSKKPKINVVLEAVEEISMVPIKVPTKRRKTVHKKDETKDQKEVETDNVKMRKKSVTRRSVNKTNKESEEKRKSDIDFWGTLDRSETQEFQTRAARMWDRLQRCESKEWVIDVGDASVPKVDESQKVLKKDETGTEQKLTSSKSAGDLENKVQAKIKSELGKSKTMSDLKKPDVGKMEVKDKQPVIKKPLVKTKDEIKVEPKTVLIKKPVETPKKDVETSKTNYTGELSKDNVTQKCDETTMKLKQDPPTTLKKDKTLSKPKQEPDVTLKKDTFLQKPKPEKPKTDLKQSKSGEITQAKEQTSYLEKSKSLDDAKSSDKKVTKPKDPLALLKQRLEQKPKVDQMLQKQMITTNDKPTPKRAVSFDKIETPVEINNVLSPPQYKVVSDLVKVETQNGVKSEASKIIEEPKVEPKADKSDRKKFGLTKIKSVKDVSVFNDQDQVEKKTKDDSGLGKSTPNKFTKAPRTKTQPLEKILRENDLSPQDMNDVINGPKIKPVEVHNNKLTEKLQNRSLTSDAKVSSDGTTAKNKICGGEQSIKIEIGKKAKSPETGSRCIDTDNDAHAIITDAAAVSTNEIASVLLLGNNNEKQRLTDNNNAQVDKSSGAVIDDKSGTALRKDTHLIKDKAIAMTNVKDADTIVVDTTQPTTGSDVEVCEESQTNDVNNNNSKRNVDESIVICDEDENNKIETVCDDNKDIDTILDASTQELTNGRRSTQNSLTKFPTYNDLSELTVENDQLNDQLDTSCTEDRNTEVSTLRSSKEAGKPILEEDEELQDLQVKPQVNKIESSDSNTEETSFSTDCSATEDWSSEESADEEEKQRLKARENLLLLLRMARNDDTPVTAAAPKPAPQKKMILDLDKMKKCYAKEEKAVITLVAKPKPLWKYVRRNKPHKRRNRKLLEKAQEMERLEREQGETSEHAAEPTGTTTHSDDSQASDANSSTKNSKSSASSDYNEYYDFSFPYYVKDEDNNLLVNSRLSQRSIDSGIGGGSSEASSSLKDPIETSHVYTQFTKTGKITPPATLIPRFKKYNIDDFHFLAVLGKGSFGKVFLAELKNSEYYYAVKALKKDIVLEDDDVECTLIERKVLALGTKHPFLCHLFATFQTDSHLFFVLEYLNGGDLMFHIQRSGRFSEDRARFYAAEIVSGLKFLHKKGIIYRDLKLDNILLDFEGHARIADFGMCKLEIYLDRTADSFCGTPDYMAPEIIKGQNYNQSVDWWSFGVLVYEMLIGQSPFSGCDEDELFWSICNEIPWFPAFLSKDALKFLQALLEKDATIRLGSLGAGDGDIIYHPFFNKINWEKLERREYTPPFKPEVLHPLDTKYFDNCFTKERARLTLIDRQILKSINQEQFDGFTYTNPNATLTGLQNGVQHAFETGLDLQDITFLDDQIYYLVQEEIQKIILDKAEEAKRLSKLRKKKKKMYFDPYTGEMKLTFTEF